MKKKSIKHKDLSKIKKGDIIFAVASYSDKLPGNNIDEEIHLILNIDNISLKFNFFIIKSTIEGEEKTYSYARYRDWLDGCWDLYKYE